MKCLLVADMHYALKQYDWVLHQAAAYDVVVLAGDHLDISSAVDIRSQITVIQTYMRRISAKTRLLVCSGNHDLDARNAAGEKYARWIQRARQFGVPTDSDSLKIGGTLFTVCPWWDGPESCRQIAPLFLNWLNFASRFPSPQLVKSCVRFYGMKRRLKRNKISSIICFVRPRSGFVPERTGHPSR